MFLLTILIMLVSRTLFRQEWITVGRTASPMRRVRDSKVGSAGARNWDYRAAAQFKK